MRVGILAAVMFVALLAAVVGTIALVRVPNMYEIQGVGEVKYTPDAAEITSSIYVENDVSVEAVKETATTMRQILSALKSVGVASDDIKTAAVRSGILDLGENKGGAAEKHPYYAEQMVVVQVHDIKQIGKVLDAIARAGSNYWFVRYKASAPEKLSAAARKAALLNAMATADQYARDGGFKRGRVLKIQDDDVKFPEVDYEDREYSTRRRYRGLVEKVVVTGTRLKEPDTTFDIPPPREETATATTNVLFEIE